MTNIVEKHVKENWARIRPGETVPEGFSLIKLNGQAADEASINLVLFAKGAKSPACFVKVNRKAGDFRGIEKEFNTLNKVKGLLPEDMRGTFPEPILMEDLKGSTAILIESFLAGKKIDFTRYRELESLFSKSFSWFKAFYSATKKGESLLNPTDLANISEAVRNDAEFHGKLRGKLMKIFERAKEKGSVYLPLASLQGDFDVDNILVNGDRIAVLDWEDYRDEAYPFLDAEIFIFSAALSFYKGDDRIRSFRRFFARDSKTFGLADGWISDFCRLVAVEKDVFYIVALEDMLGILNNGYGRHASVTMQSVDFIDALADVVFRELDLHE